uniref:Uncharacterized protein n=1 Tax=Anguilla anguilla TaxID=7936 RepID=A0A0E9PWF2_ANGAN
MNGTMCYCVLCILGLCSLVCATVCITYSGTV